MSENSSSQFLSSTSHQSSSSKKSNEYHSLLSRADHNQRYDSGHGDYEDQAEGDENVEDDINQGLLSQVPKSHSSIQSSKDVAENFKYRWPTLIAIIFTVSLASVILLNIFIAPALIEKYTKDAMVIEPTGLSIDSFTTKGFKVNVLLDLKVDASSVPDSRTRAVGRFLTWITKKVEIKQLEVKVFIPDYDGKLIGTVTIPNLVMDIRNNHKTSLDIFVDLRLEDVDIVRRVANDWLKGGLHQIRILAKSEFTLKSGLISLGSRSISKLMTFEEIKIPGIPNLHLTKLKVRAVLDPVQEKEGLAADISMVIKNYLSIELQIPALLFDVLVHGCDARNLINLASAAISPTHLFPRSEANLEVSTVTWELPRPLLQHCPKSDLSPLDLLIADYTHGQDQTVFIRGSNSSGHDVPDWISGILSSLVIPVAIPGHQFSGSLRNFSLMDAKFSLPDMFAEPGSDKADPHLSGQIMAIADIPYEIDLGMNVTRARATVKLLHKGKIFGELNLREWQDVESEFFKRQKDKTASLVVRSLLNDAPIKITDDKIFADIVWALLVQKQTVLLGVTALIDAKLSTVLGEVPIKDLAAEGTVPIAL